MRALLLAMGLSAALAGPTLSAETFALVVGVDDYPHDVSLDGAVGDAEDVYASMRAAGFVNVVKYTNAEARKDAIAGTWKDFVARAKRGDTIIFTYAGHGSQRPQIGTEEEDGLDEFLQLPGFDRNNAEATGREVILDNELTQWFADAEAKGVQVLFVSDSCFSGGMSRSIRGKTRLAPAIKVKLEPPSQDAVEGARLSELAFKQVTVLAASLESQPTPEVIIDGKPRGALSWSFARALEGSADRDGDSLITRIELEDYVFSNVKHRAEALQVPNFVPQVARSEDEVVVSLTRGIPVAEASGSTPTVDHSAEKTIRKAAELGWTGKIALQVDGAAPALENADGQGTPYRWEVAGGTFFTPNGDVAGEKIGEDRIQSVVDKFVLLDFLKALAAQNPGKVNLTPVKDIYAAGDRIRFDAPASAYGNMLVFNLANTGEVQLLDVQAAGTNSHTFKLTDLEIVKPFGADHLVVIATNEPVDAIGAVLAKRDVTPATLLQALTTRLDGKEASIAIQPLYTRETL